LIHPFSFPIGGSKFLFLPLTVPKDTLVPSISPVYFAAFLVENEIQDLFGIRFQGLARGRDL
jgi:Ni,Fe-hydrogenase III component G